MRRGLRLLMLMLVSVVVGIALVAVEATTRLLLPWLICWCKRPIPWLLLCLLLGKGGQATNRSQQPGINGDAPHLLLDKLLPLHHQDILLLLPEFLFQAHLPRHIGPIVIQNARPTEWKTSASSEARWSPHRHWILKTAQAADVHRVRIPRLMLLLLLLVLMLLLLLLLPWRRRSLLWRSRDRLWLLGRCHQKWLI